MRLAFPFRDKYCGGQYKRRHTDSPGGWTQILCQCLLSEDLCGAEMKKDSKTRVERDLCRPLGQA